MSKRFVLAVAGLAAVPTQAQLVMNGGFEQPGTGFQTVLAGQPFGGWTNAGPGDIEFVHAVPSPFLPNLEFSAFEGDYWIDLVGIGAPSAIFQSIDSLQAGDTYRIDLDDFADKLRFTVGLDAEMEATIEALSRFMTQS